MATTRAAIIFRFRKVAAALLLLAVAAGAAVWSGRTRFPAANRHSGERTVADRMSEYGDQVRARLSPFFRTAGVGYPPEKIALIAWKNRRVLQLFAADPGRDFRWIRSYPILAASGHEGPKLREGDRQMPEGIYEVESLNPNSRFHLALRLNYPNAADRARAAADARTDLGGDIMIHGGEASIGCLALGDEAAEDLFVVAALTAAKKVPVMIAPWDFREESMASPADAPGWTRSLYDELRFALAPFPPSK